MVIKPSRVTLLCHSPDGPELHEIRCCLESYQIVVDVCIFGHTLPTYQDVISLLDLQDPIVHRLSAQDFETLMGYMKSHKAKFIWVAPSMQTECHDPRAAMVLGLARTARNELSLELLTVEVDSITPLPLVSRAISQILFFRVIPPNESLKPDYEYAVIGGEIYIPRMHWQTGADAVKLHRDQDEDGFFLHKHIQLGTPGLLRTLTWNESKASNPTGGEVLIESKAIGLNFRVSVQISFCYIHASRLHRVDN
jgi:hypothetical protein